jgi:recombinational DNA repair ATPase RecF
MAIWGKNVEVAKALINHSNIDINLHQKKFDDESSSMTPLYFAVLKSYGSLLKSNFYLKLKTDRNKSIEIIRMLLAHPGTHIQQIRHLKFSKSLPMN